MSCFSWKIRKWSKHSRLTLPRKRSHTAFACGVRYGVRSTLMPLVVATRAKCCPNLRSLSRIRYLGVCPYGVASRSCCATQGSVGERVTFTWMTFRDFSSMMKKAKNERKKRSVTCKKSHAHTPCRMIAQECSPGLSTSSFGSNVLHILLDGPFTYPHTQLEEFSTDTLRSQDADCLPPSP